MPDSSARALIDNSRAGLQQLLEELRSAPERQPEIEEQIQELFRQDRAVMVLDMSGFSRTTRHAGIVAFLVMIHQMRALAEPIVYEHGGVVVKEEADNLYCLFDHPAGAAKAAGEITRRLQAANAALPEGGRLYVSVGIGYGPILNVANEDIWGNEVNLASKLGEDIAERGEVLMTEAAFDAVEDINAVPREINISGIDLTFYRLEE
ncbi:MAG: adenylate/guanylate cyclase domain-containing protein [Actinomycetota bacterium]